MYRKKSLVILHPLHPAFTPDHKLLRRHGKVIQIGIRYLFLYLTFSLIANAFVDEVKPIKTMMKALPMIRDYVHRLGRPTT